MAPLWRTKSRVRWLRAGAFDMAADYRLSPAEAHAHGIVIDTPQSRQHLRDPARRERLDFGPAKMVSATDLTDANIVMGTPAYMAPISPASRVGCAHGLPFALGLVRYEMTRESTAPERNVLRVARHPAAGCRHPAVPAWSRR